MKVYVKVIVLMISMFLISCFDSATSDNNVKPEFTDSRYPANYATGIEQIVEMNWSCSDADNDELTYDVYFGLGSDLSLYESNLDIPFLQVGRLAKFTQYSWKVVADDGMDKVSSEVFSFMTLKGANPEFSNMLPNDNSENEDTTITLSWNCTDADDENLTYDVYFGQNSLNPIATNIQENSYTIENLNQTTLYNWKIVAKDGINEVESEIRTFTTFDEYDMDFSETGYSYNFEKIFGFDYDSQYGTNGYIVTILSNEEPITFEMYINENQYINNYNWNPSHNGVFWREEIWLEQGFIAEGDVNLKFIINEKEYVNTVSPPSDINLNFSDFDPNEDYTFSWIQNNDPWQYFYEAYLHGSPGNNAFSVGGYISGNERSITISSSDLEDFSTCNYFNVQGGVIAYKYKRTGKELFYFTKSDFASKTNYIED